ncbi:winged helix-turn-helix domain-containing protein [uncultured Serinicoccus sp.]|uniref:winged helix-turn-helix domain-containing protein n=1 Tax=uncultured Serinicoccus sp. TaxID=735514 RepID=UPI0026063A9B|nr:winged helix-turn-helix domain-containing protein [uncultured Serinicoccus sp.]
MGVTHLGDVGPVPGPDAGRSMVLVIAATRAERERLLARLPDGVCVVLATSRQHAATLLGSGAAELGCREAEGAPRPEVVLDPEARTVVAGGRAVRLTPLEYDVLALLVSDQGHAWSIQELSRDVWGTSFVGDGEQVRSVIKRLRRKMGGARLPLTVETVRGCGFQARTLTVTAPTGASAGG